MHAFEFRLELVLNYQEKQKKLAELHRQQALRIVRAIEGEIDRLQLDVRGIAASMADGVGRQDVPTPWDALHAQAHVLANLLSAAEQKLLPAQAKFATANDAYKKIASLVEALQDIRKRRWQEYVDEKAEREQLRIEEFVLRRWTEMTAAPQDD
jgi:flagellar export protein FliJ